MDENIIDETDFNSAVKNIERLKRFQENFLKIAHIMKKGCKTIEGKANLQELIDYLKKGVKENNIKIQLHKEGKLREVNALRTLLFNLRPESEKLKGLLILQKDILSDLKEVKTMVKEEKEFKKIKKNKEEFIKALERNLAEELKKEEDPDYLETKFQEEIKRWLL